MISGSRLVLTTVLGIIAGLCTWWWMGYLPAAAVWTVVLSRALLGFGLGISGVPMNWALHGIVMGVIFSLPGAADAVWKGNGAAGFWAWIVSGLVIGFLIELFAVPIFHAGTARFAHPHPQPHAT